MNKINSIRKDWKLIESLIDHNSKILDIGCGEGELIEQLEKNTNAKTHGIEINSQLAKKAISKGYSVVQGDAETDLSQYSNKSFDYVILSQTLQAMIKPKNALLELLRIGGKAIVSFPNFGHWKIRTQLLFKGKMPVTNILPYEWHDTPNIHFCTIRDFVELCDELEIIIEKSFSLDSAGERKEVRNGYLGANLLGEQGVFLLSRNRS